jgi:hypothetical protein
LGFFVFATTAGVKVAGTSYTRVWIEDIGPAFDFDTFDPTASGGSGSNPGQLYTKTYSTTWTGRYDGSSNRLNSNGDIFQGQYDGTNGNQRSMLGFDYDTIQSDLNGATIQSIQLTMTNKHWYYNSGGTAVIRTHNSTASSAPTTSPTVSSVVGTFSEWPKGATWAVTLDNSVAEDLRDDNIKGLMIGPSPSGSTDKIYYGYFTGGATSSSRPKLTITYKK